MNEQAAQIAARLRALLGDDLVGVYLHGSFALGCSNPMRSDLDVLVVTERPLTTSERAAFLALPSGSFDAPGPPRPLELSSHVAAELRPWRHPAPFDLHLANGTLSGPGRDRDLAAHVTVTRRAGIAVDGPPPSDAFPEVPRADYVDALLFDFDDAVRDGWEYPRYAVLSIARVWASLAEPDVQHTKDSGAVWALPLLGRDAQPLELALESYRTHGRDIAVERAEFEAYARTVADAVHTLRP